jgi:hypothetical protein
VLQLIGQYRVTRDDNGNTTSDPNRLALDFRTRSGESCLMAAFHRNIYCHLNLFGQRAAAFARAELEQGVPGEDLLVLAARSAEFDAANQFLNQGSKLGNLAFGPPRLLWP